jgi:quinol monooxygenase YgiN
VITIVAKLQAAAGKEKELQDACAAMVANVAKNEPGVPVYSLHTSDKEPGLVLFYEQYADKAAQDAHGATDHMKAFGAGLAGLIEGRPVIERYTQIAGVK